MPLAAYNINVVGVHAADEEKYDMLVRDITSEAILFHQKTLGGFTNQKPNNN